jgi:hypothetical protein
MRNHVFISDSIAPKARKAAGFEKDQMEFSFSFWLHQKGNSISLETINESIVTFGRDTQSKKIS